MTGRKTNKRLLMKHGGQNKRGKRASLFHGGGGLHQCDLHPLYASFLAGHLDVWAGTVCGSALFYCLRVLSAQKFVAGKRDKAQGKTEGKTAGPDSGMGRTAVSGLVTDSCNFGGRHSADADKASGSVCAPSALCDDFSGRFYAHWRTPLVLLFVHVAGRLIIYGAICVFVPFAFFGGLDGLKLLLSNKPVTKETP